MTFTAYISFADGEFVEVAVSTTQDGARGAALVTMSQNEAAEEMVIEDDSITDGDKVIERWYSDGVRVWQV